MRRYVGVRHLAVGRGLLLALALVAAGLAVPAVAQSDTAGQCAHVHRNGPWSIVDPPDTSGALAQSPAAGTPNRITVSTLLNVAGRNVLLASDGVSLFRSVDDGCSWQSTYTVGVADFDGAPDAGIYTITSIATSRWQTPQAPTTAYLVLSPEVPALSGGPEVFVVSTDGGATWTLVQPNPASQAVPTCDGAPTVTIVAPGDPRRLYFSCGSAPFTLDRSDDGGASWTAATNPGNSAANDYAPFTMNTIQVDPTNPSGLWLIGSSGDASSGFKQPALWQSTDAGTSWRRLSLPVPKWSTSAAYGTSLPGFGLDVAPKTAGGTSIAVVAPVAVGPDGAPQLGVIESPDAGRSWRRIALPRWTRSGIPQVTAATYSSGSTVLNVLEQSSPARTLSTCAITMRLDRYVGKQRNRALMLQPDFSAGRLVGWTWPRGNGIGPTSLAGLGQLSSSSSAPCITRQALVLLRS